MEKEIWKDIVGYEGLYQVSNLGSVKNLSKNKVLKGYNHLGYMRANLYKDGQIKKYLIHRLVAQAFIEKQENKLIINHKNNRKCDNRVENLEYCTQKENVNHYFDNFCDKEILTKKMRKRFKKSVLCYENLKFIKKYECLNDVKQDNFSPSEVYRSCNTNTKTKGYYFYYKDTFCKDDLKLQKHNAKRVLQFDKNGVFLREWDNTEKIKNNLNIKTSISLVCNGKRKTAGGYIWRYKNE